MSLDKAIAHKKEHRKSYFGAKAVDKTCRNHGTCDWCKNNRLYNTNKQLEYIKYSYIDFDEYYNETIYWRRDYKSELAGYSAKFIEEYRRLSEIIEGKHQNSSNYFSPRIFWNRNFKTWDEYYDYVLEDS